MSNRSAVDERTSSPSEASRRGAHRARPGALPSGLPIVAGVVVMLLVVGGVFYGLRDRSVTSTGTVSAADADATASATRSPGASRSAAPQASQSAGTTRTAAPVTKNVRIKVLNSVSVAGLAAQAKSSLEAEGWTVTSTGNTQQQRDLATSVVYYGRANLRATARQIAKDLGYGTATPNTRIVSGMNITVVLGRDAQ